MKQISLSNQCTLLRYELNYHKQDCFGVKHSYQTSPAFYDGEINGGGINYFDNSEDLQRWINQVKEIRRFASDNQMTLLEYLQ